MKKAILFLILAIFIAFFGAYIYLGFESSERRGLVISNSDIRGASIDSDGLEYTLNFDQQNALVHLLNHAKKVRARAAKAQKAKVRAIMIYRFHNEDPMILKPMSEEYSIFSVSSWKKGDYLKIKNLDDLRFLLATST